MYQKVVFLCFAVPLTDNQSTMHFAPREKCEVQKQGWISPLSLNHCSDKGLPDSWSDFLERLFHGSVNMCGTIPFFHRVSAQQITKAWTLTDVYMVFPSFIILHHILYLLLLVLLTMPLWFWRTIFLKMTVFIGELLRAMSGAPYLRKFGNPSISKILVGMWLSICTYIRTPSPIP